MFRVNVGSMFRGVAAMLGLSAAIQEAQVMRLHHRMGPGRKTLYTVWKNVDSRYRDAAPAITWPDPLTRQCWRQINRMNAKEQRRKDRIQHRRAVSLELKAARAAGLNLPTWRAAQVAA